MQTIIELTAGVIIGILLILNIDVFSALMGVGDTNFTTRFDKMCGFSWREVILWSPVISLLCLCYFLFTINLISGIITGALSTRRTP